MAEKLKNEDLGKSPCGRVSQHIRHQPHQWVYTFNEKPGRQIVTTSYCEGFSVPDPIVIDKIQDFLSEQSQGNIQLTRSTAQGVIDIMRAYGV